MKLSEFSNGLNEQYEKTCTLMFQEGSIFPTQIFATQTIYNLEDIATEVHVKMAVEKIFSHSKENVSQELKSCTWSAIVEIKPRNQNVVTVASNFFEHLRSEISDCDRVFDKVLINGTKMIYT